MDKGGMKLPALTVAFRKWHGSGRSPCIVLALGETDRTDALKPIIDRLPELAQPAGGLSAEVRRRYRGVTDTDGPAWHVSGSPESLVILDYSNRSGGIAHLLGTEPTTK